MNTGNNLNQVTLNDSNRGSSWWCVKNCVNSESWYLKLELGINYYQARFYDAALGRFTQPDEIVPVGVQGIQAFDRFAYANNNSVRYIDPTGHALESGCEYESCGADPATVFEPYPPVVLYIHQMMTLNAQGETVRNLQALNSQCFNCGVIPDPDVQRATALADTLAEYQAFGIFGWKVRQGGEWDPKPILVDEFGSDVYWEPINGGGEEYYYDLWGNIMFGYLGAASGFSEYDLLEGAGVEQIGSSLGYTIKMMDLEYWPSCTSGVDGFRSFDDPADQLGAKIGIQLWNMYGLAVSPQDIIDLVSETAGLTTR